MGEIPNKWEIKKFKDISKVSQGLQIAIEERFKEFKENRLPYITIQYINDKFNRDNEYFIENYNESVVCKKDDILMTRTGNTGIIVTNEYGVFHNNFFKVNFDRKKLNKSFLVYYLNTSFIQNLISRYAGTTTIPDLKHGDFYKLPVVIPSMEEQNKIVAILSTLDEQIENTEKLIQKNQELKKGLMQQLLTKGIGHTEFKKTELGYIPKEWEVKKLGEIFKLSSGSFLSQKNIIEGEYPVYGGNGISGYHNDYLFDESKLIIGRVGAKCGCIHISNYKSWITDNALYISEKIIDFDNKFMYYLLKYKDLNKYANQNAQPVISGKKIYSINVAFPPYHEQVSIALILLNMDKKIKEYKIRKHNLEELKSGLMQQLFTGKIRVI